MNSISENLDQVISNPASKAEFVVQFEVIVKGVEESMLRQRDILSQKTQRVDDLKAVHQKVGPRLHRYCSYFTVLAAPIGIVCNSNSNVIAFVGYS